jgi:hypothetical protein
LVGFGTLGISAIAVALTSPSKHPEAKKDLIALTTSFPTIPQQENYCSKKIKGLPLISLTRNGFLALAAQSVACSLAQRLSR